MEINEIIKTLMGDKNITQGEITKLLGMKSQSGVSQALNRDMKISMVLRFLKCMNCELIVRDKNSKTEWIVEND